MHAPTQEHIDPGRGTTVIEEGTAAMSLSSVSVIGNTLRLRTVEPD